MRYEVVKIVPIRKDSAVVIKGNGASLKNGILINDGKHRILSVGTASGDVGERTSLIIEGSFSDDVVFV